MKWYFCISEASLQREQHGWGQLLVAAVDSALANTSLSPILVYDGEPNALTEAVEARGVKVIRHRVSFYEALAERDKTQPGYLAIASGAFLRVEIPLLERDDDFVLYTDCDVNFLSNPNLDGLQPEYFSGAPQTSKTDYENDLNTGVMLMNVAQLRKDLPAFSRFIVDNLYAGWPGCDQENYRRFYRGKWSPLPLELNWKPYWGSNVRATILHWHGPKPAGIRDKLSNPSHVMPNDWEVLFAQNTEAYRSFLARVTDAGRTTFDNGLLGFSSEDLIGNIDGVSNKTIYGWVLRREQPTTLAGFHIAVGDTHRLVAEGAEQRPDLKRLYSTDLGGFHVNLPPDLAALPEVELRFLDTNGKPVELGHMGYKRKSLLLRDGRIVRDAESPVHVSSSPMMPPESAAYLIEKLKRCRTYLEYGTGGTTIKAAELGVPRMICVESDAEWLDAVNRKLGTVRSKTASHLMHIDVGPTKELGFPEDDQGWRRYKDYSIEPWLRAKQEGWQPDLVLVDGRFRVSSFLASLLMAAPGTCILFDDYADRAYYHHVERFLPRSRTIDRVAEFIVPKRLSRDDIWLALISSVSDAA